MRGIFKSSRIESFYALSLFASASHAATFAVNAALVVSQW